MTALAPNLAGASNAIGWTLIHFVWQGTVLALLLGLVLLVIPRRLARARYAAGCATLAAMLAAPAWTLWQLMAAGVPGGIFEPILSADLPGAMAAFPESGTPIGFDSQALMPWLAAAWMLGVAFCLFRHAGGLWQAHRMVRIGTRPAPAFLEVMMNELVARLQIPGAVTLLESARVQVPVVVGYLKPVVLVPASVLSGLTPRQLEAVLAHELAHVARHDYLANLIQAAVETLLFYHPAVWWVSHVVRAEREHCCDDLAVAVCGDRLLYARALTAIEAIRHDSFVPALSATGGSLPARIRRLLGSPQPARVSSSGYVVAALTLVMVSGAGTFSWVDDLPALVDSGVAASRPVLPSPPAAPAAVVALETGRLVSPLRWRLEAGQTPATGTSQQDRADTSSPDGSRTELAETRRALEAARASITDALSRQREAVRTVRQAARQAGRSGLSEEARALSQEARQLSLEARDLSLEAARQARELLRTAQQAMREASRIARESQRLQRELRHQTLAPPKPPRPDPAPKPPDVAPATPPEPPPPPKPPPPPQQKPQDDQAMFSGDRVPPVAPVLPALPAVPAPPAVPTSSAVPAPPAVPASSAVPAPPAIPAPPAVAPIPTDAVPPVLAPPAPPQPPPAPLPSEDEADDEPPVKERIVIRIASRPDSGS